MRRIWKLFSSVRLAIALLILLAAASLVGTLVPQGLPAAAAAARYGRLSGLFSALRLTGVYHSAWFLALLLLLAVNTAVCTITRLPAKWRRATGPEVASDPAALQASKVHCRFGQGGPAAAVRARLETLLAARRYRVRSERREKRTSLLAQKRRLGLFGSDAVHLGLLVIICGGVVSGLAGVRGQLELSEGQTARVPGAGFDIRLDRFETEYYPQGTVKAWKSTVTLLEGGAAVLTRTIQVNRPLSYKGYNFYQTSYGADWENALLEIGVRKKSDPSFDRTVRLRARERAALDDRDVSQVSVARFVPDFVLGEGGRVESRSGEPNNPAAEVEAWKDGRKVFSGWVFARYPDFERSHAGKPADLSFVLRSFRPSEFSALEAALDPGVGLVWAGCLLVGAGFFLVFYWTPREIRVVLDEGRERTEVTAAGHAAKAREVLEAEFGEIMESLRRSA